MISYRVTIPETKQSFFQEFLEIIGADYERKQDDFQLSDKQKKMLDDRINADKNFIPAREALNKLRKKYDL